MGKFLGRWAPLVGGLILAASVVLPIFGQAELANLLAGLGSLIGVSGQSPVSAGELTDAVVKVTAAVTVLIGIFRKFKSVLAEKVG